MRLTLPVKVGILMTLAAALVSAAGYLTYKSLSSIVASINIKSRPDLRLLIIRDITTDLDKAESSVRMYRLTRNRQDIKPYYTIIGGIDNKIDSLRSASSNDTSLLPQMDTISSLIEENMLVWNEMIDLYHTDSLEIYVRTLTAKIAVGTLNKKNTKYSILKRVFSRKAIKEQELQEELEQQQKQKEIISSLNRMEQQDSIKNSLLLATETKLASTGNEIRERLYLLMSRMENEVIRSIKMNSAAAESLANQTFQRLAVFAVLATLLIISVLMVVVRYVRKTREYQKALEKSRVETEQLARTKELFIANMSHEIRTPVNAIHGFTEQLFHEPLNEKSQEMLGVVKSTSEHLMQVVNDILDFSRLQNARIELEKNHFLARQLFEDVKTLFTRNATANHSRILCKVSDTVPQVLYGDSHRLKQILLNLAGNAVKFTRNGEILISADASEKENDQLDLIVCVSDNGIGINKEMQNRVFEDFIQAEAGTSRKYGGTGLGLSIVKKLVELHQGEIKLDSLEGKGTTVTCILPYHTGNISYIETSAEKIVIPEKIRNSRILIVDDEEYNRLLFKTIFSRWGVKYDEADDGTKAIEKIKNGGNYDLVFMDARMPGLDGLEAADFIRDRLGIKTEEMPIVGTSATHAVNDLQLYLSSGMNGFLPKPFTEKMLLDTMLSLLPAKKKERAPVFSGTGITGAAGTGTPVNLSNIYHLANNDLSFVKQLVTTFIESTEQGLTGLQDAINSRDLHTIHEIAHKISSPCKHVGAESLYARLKLIEQQSENLENIGILAKLSTDSAREFMEIKTGLQNHLEKI